MKKESESAATVFEYHERTKHGFERWADSPGGLDWDNQPDPFRRFEGAASFQLPIPTRDSTPTFPMLNLPGGIPPRPVDAQSLSELFFYSLALSAWKEQGRARWALRVNPSSGNLHPTETYLVLPTAGTGVPAGLYHYAPLAHALERRTLYADRAGAALARGLPEGTLLLALNSIPWREAWKYGERAYRYCQHDIGHALAALRFSTALLGWNAKTLGAVPDDELSLLLGGRREDSWHEGEREIPELLLALSPGGDIPEGWRPPTEAVVAASASAWEGKANELSPEHRDWPGVEAAASACRALVPVARGGPKPPKLTEHPSLSSLSAAQVIRGRRSAVRMDGNSGLKAGPFLRMLTRLDPARAPAPWDCLDWPPCVHLVFFVHRIEGLAPGLYLQAREAGRLDALKGAMKGDFLWKRPAAAPRGLGFFLLKEGDMRRLSADLACGQDIAAEGAFSAAMLAEFEPRLREFGVSFYRNLFWECGTLGQVLYLEAEAAGLRGTGIGCYFDDPTHELLGLSGRDFQCLYQFTVGGALEDQRLRTSPAYPRLG